MTKGKLTSLNTPTILIAVVLLHLRKRISFVTVITKIKPYEMYDTKHDVKSTHELSVEDCQQIQYEITRETNENVKRIQDLLMKCLYLCR